MIHGETPCDWSCLGTGHKSNILTTDDSCSFRPMQSKAIGEVLLVIIYYGTCNCFSRIVVWLKTKNKAKSSFNTEKMDFLPPVCPDLIFQHETYVAHYRGPLQRPINRQGKQIDFQDGRERMNCNALIVE